MTTKQTLGQFMTTNYRYILQNVSIPENVHIIEPFCGKGDLLQWIVGEHVIECYDIDPQTITTIQRDTLLDPPTYENKFVLTNPPYLARNKSTNKTIFNKYNVNDLYKCFIKEICTHHVIGGILIIPLNFWSSIRISDIHLRKLFIEQYQILHLNIFEEQVFNDTSYTICSFQFERRTNEHYIIPTIIYPQRTHIELVLDTATHFSIGGEIYNLPLKSIYKITRWTNKNERNTNILVKCIDDSSHNRICCSIVDTDMCYIDSSNKHSARSYATLVIHPIISLEQQTRVVDEFNLLLNTYRQQYNSLFLSNYRESTDIARKRISFDLVYSIIQYLLEI